MNNKEITFEDVIKWIMDNVDDEKAMDKISLAAYPYSSKFRTRYSDYPGNRNPKS